MTGLEWRPGGIEGWGTAWEDLMAHGIMRAGGRAQGCMVEGWRLEGWRGFLLIVPGRDMEWMTCLQQRVEEIYNVIVVGGVSIVK